MHSRQARDAKTRHHRSKRSGVAHWRLRISRGVRQRGFWLSALLLAAATLLHYWTAQDRRLSSVMFSRHALERILFVLPVTGATFALGRAGGLAALALVFLIMLPRVFFISPYPVDAFLEVLAATLIGYHVVWVLGEKEKHRESYEQAAARLEILATVTAALNQSLELDRILNDVLDRIMEVMDVTASAVFLVDEEGRGLRLAAHRNLPPDMVQSVGRLRSARTLEGHEGLECQLAVPIRSKEKINGLLAVFRPEPCPFPLEEADLIPTIANQISVAVENARLVQDTSRQLQIERAVGEVVEEITSELELDKVLPKVIQIAERLVGADGGLVALWDEERSVITYPYLHNLPRELASVTVHQGEGLAGEVMATGQPIVIDDYPTYALAVRAFVEAGVTSIAGVPIVRGGRTFGALALLSIGEPKHFPDRDVQILTGIGRQAGIAVENAYLYENLRFYARRITQAQENERRRIARELHDDTIQSLIVLSRRLEALATSDEELPEGAEYRVKDLRELTDDAIKRVRRFSQDLRPSILDDLGLLPTLEELTNNMNREADLHAEFLVLGRKRRLPSDVELTLFRIAQEALNNVRKHAGATRVVTTIELTSSSVKMMIQDDGKGFRPPRLTEHLAITGELGLMGMLERARLVGGSLVVESKPGRGTGVTVSVTA